MNTPTTDDSVLSEKMRRGSMRQEMADFAHALVRRADLRSSSLRP